MSEEGTIKRVGPIAFSGLAVERVARIREDNDAEPVDIDAWRANIDAQHDDFDQADADFFSTLRAKMV